MVRRPAHGSQGLARGSARQSPSCGPVHGWCGVISEGCITNIAFFDGDAILWPATPVLDGITMQILERQLPACGVPSRRIPVDTTAMRAFRAAFVTNARGIAPVGQIDDLSLPVDGTLLATLTGAYESAGWDPI